MVSIDHIDLIDHIDHINLIDHIYSTRTIRFVNVPNGVDNS